VTPAMKIRFCEILALPGNADRVDRPQVRCMLSSRILFSVALALCGRPVFAQWLNYPTPGIPRLPDGKPNLNAPAPRTPDGKPDLSGLWQPGATVANRFGNGQLPAEWANIAASLKEPLPYRPWGLELSKSRQANNAKDSPSGRCLPLSIVQKHSEPTPRKMLQFPGLLVILYEIGTEYRQIFTDGRPLPVDPNPSFLGYSSGRWEGDTLVVQTIGIRDDEWLDARGTPLTDAARITERFRRPNFGTLEIDLTVDDSKAYTEPWTIKLKQQLEIDTDLLEDFCENNRDLPHLVGK
jgi:hypothetical protein